MASQTEAKYPGDVVKYEAGSQYSREEFVIKSGAVLVCGEVCHDDAGQKDALAAADNAAADSVYIGPSVTGDGTIKGVFIVRHAIVDKEQLDYGAASTPATVDLTLEGLGILVRREAPNAN